MTVVRPALAVLAVGILAGCGSSVASQTPVPATQPGAEGAEAAEAADGAVAGMCLDALRVDGVFFMRDGFTSAVSPPDPSWSSIGAVEGGLPCNDTGGSVPTPPVGIVAAAQPLGTTVFAVPTDASVRIVGRPDGPVVYRRDDADRLAFDAAVIEIRVSSYDGATGDVDGSPLTTITDADRIRRLIDGARAAARFDSLHFDNQWDVVVELVRDDGLRTQLLYDRSARHLDHRVVGTEWADLVGTVIDSM